MQNKKIDFILYVVMIIAITVCMRGCLLVHEYEDEQRVKQVMEITKQ